MKYYLNPNRREKSLAIRLSPEEWQRLDTLTGAMGMAKRTDTIRALINAEMDIRIFLKEVLELSRCCANGQKELSEQFASLQRLLGATTYTKRGGVGSPHNRR